MGVYWTDERGVTDWRCLMCGAPEATVGCECTEEEFERACAEAAERGRRILVCKAGRPRTPPQETGT